MTDKDLNLPDISISSIDSITPLPTLDLSGLNGGYTISSSAIGAMVGAGSTTYATPWTTGTSFNWNPTNSIPMTVNKSGRIELKGEDADIEINGYSLVSTIKRIEERLNILAVNPNLEAEWDDLRELGDQYRALEQKIKDKMETWRRLNAGDRDNR